MNVVEVVAGVTVRGGRMLLAQRPADKDFAFMWECPGGKVDDGEDHARALRREWAEELDCLIATVAPQPMWQGIFDNEVVRADRGRVLVLFYQVWLADSAVPVPQEGQGLGWFRPDEIRKLALAPANERATERIIESVWKQ
jgi:8-oxo-dGTP diphosphatase